MRLFLLSVIAGAAMTACGGMAAAPMETSPAYMSGASQSPSQPHANDYVIAMGARGALSGSRLQERRSVATETLSSAQVTRLHTFVASGILHSINQANFALSVGQRIPRTVRIYSVPKSIADVVPQYRDFDYIVVKNDLLIIDPRTLEILYVLPG